MAPFAPGECCSCSSWNDDFKHPASQQPGAPVPRGSRIYSTLWPDGYCSPADRQTEPSACLGWRGAFNDAWGWAASGISCLCHWEESHPALFCFSVPLWGINPAWPGAYPCVTPRPRCANTSNAEPHRHPPAPASTDVTPPGHGPENRETVCSIVPFVLTLSWPCNAPKPLPNPSQAVCTDTPRPRSHRTHDSLHFSGSGPSPPASSE